MTYILSSRFNAFCIPSSISHIGFLRAQTRTKAGQAVAVALDDSRGLLVSSVVILASDAGVESVDVKDLRSFVVGIAIFIVVGGCLTIRDC